MITVIESSDLEVEQVLFAGMVCLSKTQNTHPDSLLNRFLADDK